MKVVDEVKIVGEVHFEVFGEIIGGEIIGE